MPTGHYSVRYSAAAVAMLAAVSDRRVRALLLKRGEGLAEAPVAVGKPLIGPLSGYRSIRAVGQRYRLVYRVDEPAATVWIVAAGLRKQGDRRDVYRLLSAGPE